MSGGTVSGTVRHRDTGQYYAGSGEWTADAGEAMQFQSVTEVVNEAQRHGLRDCCEFIVSLPDRPGVHISLPL